MLFSQFVARHWKRNMTHNHWTLLLLNFLTSKNSNLHLYTICINLIILIFLYNTTHLKKKINNWNYLNERNIMLKNTVSKKELISVNNIQKYMEGCNIISSLTSKPYITSHMTWSHDQHDSFVQYSYWYGMLNSFTGVGTSRNFTIIIL